MRGKKVYKVLFPLLILVSFLSIGSQVAKSYYDAKKIYDEVKPSLTNEEMLSRKEKNEALILLYHNVTNSKKASQEDDLYVHIDDFRKQLDYIVGNGYNVITLEELYRLRKSCEEIPEKTLVLTFDDGDKSSYDTVFPELQKRNLKASFFVTTRQLGERGYVTKDNLVEMHEAGQDIESQGHNNEDFINTSLAQVHKSMYISKKILEETLNKPVLFLVYPNSSFNSEVIRVAQDVGYEWALSTEPGEFFDHYMTMERVSIPGGSDIDIFKQKLAEYGY
ncbi:Polysaccharide deacetylase [Candidatus Arthromitus sp. SFB-mouse-NL]|uniref:polysaccharide deacetylase family protein n=1 Tax=Candidatus Arthromitus sp. SFB-mouse-NL TaxID=1508644 RepID=UPI00049B030B|nr:polysaccharide deacetylase family protein [Candidatus Arthromitus sp. SFB-mouse-NL]AID45008.1 Polysaccharide deacetylase [Candidatus Arthromitus sp. SFB-mouse-NL]